MSGFQKAVAPKKAASKATTPASKATKPKPGSKKPVQAATGPKSVAKAGAGTKKAATVAATAAPVAAAPPVAAPPPPPPPPPPPVIGHVRVRYNHYNQEFEVSDGVLRWEAIDEKYCISFVFKGRFGVTLVAEGAGAGGAGLAPDGGSLTRGVDEEGEPTTTGSFSGVALVDGGGQQASYLLVVTEDDEAEEAAAAGRRAAGIEEGYRAPSAIGVTSGSAAVTAELKSMSIDELKAKGGHYQALLEARDLEDVLYGSG